MNRLSDRYNEFFKKAVDDTTLYAINFYDSVPRFSYRNVDWKNVKIAAAVLMAAAFVTVLLFARQYSAPPAAEKREEFTVTEMDKEVFVDSSMWPTTRMDDFLKIPESAIANGYMAEGISGVSIYQLISMNMAKLKEHDLECLFPVDYLKVPFNILSTRDGRSFLNVKVMERSGNPSFVSVASNMRPSSVRWFDFYPTLVISEHTGQNLTVASQETSMCIQSYM